MKPQIVICPMCGKAMKEAGEKQEVQKLNVYFRCRPCGMTVMFSFRLAPQNYPMTPGERN